MSTRFLYAFKNMFFIDFLEIKEGRGREREKEVSILSEAPWGPNSQPGHVP